MTIHSHSRPEPDPLAGAVSLALGCATGAGAAELEGAVAVAVTVTVGTEGLELVAAGELGLSAAEEVGLSAGVELVAWPEVRLEIALLMLLLMLELQAVTVPAAQTIVAARSRLPVGRRISRINGPFPGEECRCSAVSLARPPSPRVTPNG